MVPLCTFGRPSPIDPEWTGDGHCRGCLAHEYELLMQFAADVLSEKYDMDGRTPAEKRAKARRAT